MIKGKTYKKYLCKHFLMTGTCPHDERCFYIHDERIKTDYCLVLRMSKNKQEYIDDLFFWTFNESENICQYEINAKSITYSIWNHFLNMCLNVIDWYPDLKYNVYNRRRRLPIFQTMSLGQSVK